MASSHDTTCPGCGGRAHWNTDDGITYCDNNGPDGCYEKALARGESGQCASVHIEQSEYTPPSRRGGA